MAWSQLGKDIDGEDGGDYSGWATSLSADGSVIAIGGYRNNGNGAASGHVRIFKFSNGKWNQIGSDIDGESPNGYGYSVSLSSDGTVVAIGTPIPNGFTGRVRVYQNINSNWVQIGNDIEGQTKGDYQGVEISLSGDGSFLAIGSNFSSGTSENGQFLEENGHVSVFQKINNDWVQIGANIEGEQSDDHSGQWLSLSSNGSVLAIGSGSNIGKGNNGEDGGHVRIYRRGNNKWNQIGEDIDGEPGEFISRCSLSSDGSVVAIGGTGGNGVVRVLKNVGDSWIQVGESIKGLVEDDFFAFSLSLSSDGNFLAISDPGKNSVFPISEKKGYVRIFQNINNNWIQIGEDIQGESFDDASGWTVNLSSDGGIVSIGSFLNDGNGINSGHVRIFKFTPEEIFGTSGSDSLIGTSSSDLITGLEGDDTIDGGLGSDASIYSGKFSDYLITRTRGSLIVSVKRTVTNNGTDTLSNIEYIQFTDHRVEE